MSICRAYDGWRVEGKHWFRQGSYFSKHINNNPQPQTPMEITFLNMMNHKDIVALLKGTRKNHNAPDNNPCGWEV